MAGQLPDRLSEGQLRHIARTRRSESYGCHDWLDDWLRRPDRGDDVQRHRLGRGRGWRGEHQVDQAGPRDADGRTDAHRGDALPAVGGQIAAHLAVGQRPADPQHVRAPARP